MWFPDDATWKLINFEWASQGGRVSIEQQNNIGTSSSQSQEETEDELHFSPSADIRAVGVIGLQIQTGKIFADWSEQRDSHSNSGRDIHLDTDITQRCTSSDLHRTHHGSDHERFYSFMQRLLDQDPANKVTADEALSDSFFRRGEDTYRRNDISSERFCSEHDVDHFLHVIVGPRLKVDAKIEVFRKRNDSASSFDAFTAETKDALVVRDKALPNESVFIVKSGRKFRIRLTVSYGNCQLPVRTIQSVSMKTMTGEFVTLQHSIVQSESEDWQMTVLAIVNPSDRSLGELCSVCPQFGNVEQKYKKAILNLDFLIDRSFHSVLSKKFTLRFLVVSPRNPLLINRIERKIREKYLQLPAYLQKVPGWFCWGCSAILPML